MNILFCTQSESLNLFHALSEQLRQDFPGQQSGFVVSDSMAYKNYCSNHRNFEKENQYVLKEWEITAAPFESVDLQKLKQDENRLSSNAGLFGAIVADRRLFMGADCTFTQDYRRRFKDEELLCILNRAIDQIESLFDQLKPDLVVSFICVTMLDYLAYLVAKSRGIRVLNLRPTRVGDRIAFSKNLNDPSPELAQEYKSLIVNNQSSYLTAAQDYIKRVREQNGRYEGVVAPSDKPALKIQSDQLFKLSKLKAVGRWLTEYYGSESKTDNHVPDPIRRFYFTVLRNPLHAKRVKYFFQGKYLEQGDLGKLRYAFFPLHTEPEVSLLVYGRPYVNQIELIRMISMSLPVNMVLLVKEHPWMIGKRSLAAYKKMLEIPRVKFVNPKLEARTVIGHADLITVITGSVALEAAITGKPVITFGDCPYNLLPDSMVRRCADPRALQNTIKKSLAEYKSDEQALLAYISAVFESSVSCNLYSILLGKANVHSERASTYSDEIKKLKAYLIEFMQGPEASEEQHKDASYW